MNKELTTHREYRAVGKFSAEEVRKLAPGPLNAIDCGCPAELFARVLEKRSALRARGWRLPVAKPVVAPARAKYKANDRF